MCEVLNFRRYFRQLLPLATCVWVASLGLQTVYGDEGERLKVVASDLPPCVIIGDENLGGYSIDLWQEIAAELSLEDSYELQITDFITKMKLVESGEADIAIGCISVSEQREQVLDFTHPVAEGGLRAVSLISSSWFPTFSDESRNMLFVLLAFVVISAHIMWLAERGSTAIHDGYFPGIFEAAWFSIVTMSTVGYGDIAPRGWWGRISALVLILSGVAAFGVIVSQFTADAITDPAENAVVDTQDLRQYQVGTKEGTVAEDFLKSNAVELRSFIDQNQAIGALRAGEIDLILFDSLYTAHLVARNPDLVETGPLMDSHYLAITLPQDSELREPINTALLKLQQSGLLQTIQDRWF